MSHRDFIEKWSKSMKINENHDFPRFSKKSKVPKNIFLPTFSSVSSRINATSDDARRSQPLVLMFSSVYSCWYSRNRPGLPTADFIEKSRKITKSMKIHENHEFLRISKHFKKIQKWRNFMFLQPFSIVSTRINVEKY